ncbi:hypothetical protein [Deinococcus sp.]|uniref:hypothetical protein n=1 Tax=Deinococcus sp. TaxID=47478 RepID=UPI003B5C6350
MTHLKDHWFALLLLIGIGFIHFKDIPDKLGETPYLGWLYILLVAGCAAAGAWLLSSHWKNGYTLGLLISAGAIIFYVLTRSTGLPNATGDIGNWAEPAGIISLILEAAFVVVAIVALRRPAPALDTSAAD